MLSMTPVPWLRYCDGAMTHYYFSVVLEPDREEPHRYNVRVPALPGCLTYGESIEDALANAHEAITGYVESLLAD